MGSNQFTPAAVPDVRADAGVGLRWDAKTRAHDNGLPCIGDSDTLSLRMLAHADLYWISEEMSELCRDAGEDLKEVHLGRDLWPSENGFMVFATPVPLDGYTWKNANDQSLEPIRAICWYPEDGLLSVVLFTDAEAVIRATALRLDSDSTPEALASKFATFSTSTGIRWVVACGGDMYPIEHTFDASDREGAGQPAAFMLSTVWLLMNQKGVASITRGAEAIPAPANRGARRRQAPIRDQLDKLRIIEIRAGTDHSAAYSGTTREHRHRWMVKGHWRKQWYPSLGMNRPIWVAPYMKGPEGAPLLTGTKVHTWKGN